MKVKGWYLMGLLSLINFFTGCGAASMNNDIKSATQFKWYPVATAPVDYPMEVISGTFFFKEQNVGLPIPSGGTLRQGWGKSSSVYVLGDEPPPLPDRVEVKFYSYAENQFYQAEFALPYDVILEKFQKFQPEEPNDKNYSHFILGIAPGGAVSVWLGGPKVLEVFFGQAKKIEMSPEAAFALPFKSQEQSDHYVASALAESVTPEQLARIKTHGAPIGTWARYRNLYKWSPIFRDGKVSPRPMMPVHFLNGESYWIPTKFDEELANTPKPLPLHMEFRAQVAKDDIPFYIIDFEPIELMEAFEKLGANGEKVFIEFDAQVPRQNLKIRVYNDEIPKDDKTPKEFIELKNFYVKP